MGQDIVFIQHSSAVTTPPSDSDEMLEDGSMIIDCMSLGSGDAWPCYVRLWFIAAYQYVRVNRHSIPHYGRVLTAIKKCCPIERPSQDTMINSKECANPSNIILLANAELDILAWLATRPSRIEGYHFRETGRVLNLLQPYIPLNEEGLDTSPYPASDEYNIGDERCDQLESLFNTDLRGVYAE